VSNLAVTSIDQVNEIVSGTADPGTIEIYAENTSEWAFLEISTSPDGSWSVDLSEYMDINNETDGYLHQYDLDGDRTQLIWFRP